MLLKEVPFAPGYFVDKNGDIISFKKSKKGIKIKVDTRKYNGNNPAVVLYINNKAFNTTKNRVVCFTYHGPPPTDKHKALTINGNINDGRPENLRWGLFNEDLSNKKFGKLTPISYNFLDKNGGYLNVIVEMKKL